MGALGDLQPYAICIIVVTVAVFATEVVGGGPLLAIMHPVLALLVSPFVILYYMDLAAYPLL